MALFDWFKRAAVPTTFSADDVTALINDRPVQVQIKKKDGTVRSTVTVRIDEMTEAQVMQTATVVSEIERYVMIAPAGTDVWPDDLVRETTGGRAYRVETVTKTVPNRVEAVLYLAE